MGRRTIAAVSGDPSPSSSSSTTTESSFRELDDVFLQTQTRIWLGEVLHARLDDQLNISDLLADGELLLEVSKILWTMLISKCKELEIVKGHKYNPAGSRKSSGRYRPYSNVDSFLKMCKILGLSGIDLFSPSDVVEKRDTRKVCICLRSLSKKARSKQLKVPDFDIVTYNVAMPTNMVGYLRKSLEPSRGSYSSSIYDPELEDSKLGCRKKDSVATSERNFDSYSEASDDEAESKYMGGPPYFSPENYSCDTIRKDSGFENPLRVSSVVKNYTLARSASQEDGEYGYVAKQGGSLCSQDANSMSPPSVESRLNFTRKSPIHNGRTRRGSIQEMGEVELTDAESAIEDDAFLGDSSDEKTVEKLYVCSHSTFPDLLAFGADEETPFQLEGEDNPFSLLLGTDCHGSNSTGRISLNGFGRRSFDDFEDVEVSSVTSMSSVLGRALDLEFDDQIDVEEDSGTTEVSVIDLQINETSSDYSEVSSCKTELEKFRFSSPLVSPCPNNPEPRTKGYRDCASTFGCGVSTYQRSSGDPKPIVSAENGAATVEPCPPGMKIEQQKVACSSSCIVVDGNLDHDVVNSSNGGAEKSGLVLHHKDENSHDTVDKLCEVGGENVEPRRPSGTKAHRSPLLRTVIKGTALCGVFFLLHHLSGKNGRSMREQVSEKFSKIQKASCEGGSKSREEKKEEKRVHGIYPAQLFKF